MALLQSFKKKDQDMPINYKDTFRLIEDRGKTESPASSSVHSSIPELSRLEERQLHRSFQAIQRPETPPSPKEEEFGGHFNMTFRDTTSDSDRDHTKQKMYKRQTSVDSEEDERFQRARGSGMFKSSKTGSKESVLTMGSADSSFVQVTPRDKIDTSIDMEDKLEKLAAATDNALWDISPETSVHVVPQYTRDRTPDTTASRGNLIIGGSISSTSASLNRANLDSTMREQIRDVHRDQIQIDETSFSPKSATSDSNTYLADQTNPTSPYYTKQSNGNPLGMTMRDVIRGHSGEFTSSNSQHRATDSPDVGTVLQRKSQEAEDEKIPPCWPRCVAVGVGLAMLLAGIVALIIVFDENRKQEGTVGRIVDDPIDYQECGNIKLNLTDTFKIQCRFKIDHDTRTGLKNPTTVMITKPDRTRTTETVPFINITSGDWSSRLEETATCSSIGNYNLRFKNVADEFQLNVTLGYFEQSYSLNDWLNRLLTHVLKHYRTKFENLEPFILSQSVQERISPTMVTNLDQNFFNDTVRSSEFRLECSVSGDCIRYKMDIVGINRNAEVELNENLTCMTYYSKRLGTRLNCTATIPASVVSQYSQLGCRISSPETSTKYKVFQYPTCGRLSSCPVVNCSNGSDDRELIDQCDLVSFVNDCFHPGRKVYSFCKDDQNSCSCMMNWCQSGEEILNSEIPGKLLCDSEYQPITFTARPTTEKTTTGVV